MQHAPPRYRRRLLAGLAVVVGLVSCNPHAMIAPFRTVSGVWRGAGWGLEASADGAALHEACGEVFPLTRRLAWDQDLRARGTTAAHELDVQALPDGRLALRVNGDDDRIDTLQRAPRASFDGAIICE